jgi:hypothetical protein
VAQWYYSRDNKQKLGPFSAAQLKEMAVSGELQPSDMVLRDGSRKWASASSIKGLFAKKASADRPAPPPPPRTSPRRKAVPTSPDARGAEQPARQGKRRSGKIATIAAFLLLLLAGAEAAGLLWQQAEFDRRLAEADRQVQDGAAATAGLDQRLAESEQQARGDAKARAAMEQRLADAEQQARQQAGKAGSLEARLAESERRAKEAAAEAVTWRKRLADSEQKARDAAAEAAALKRRLCLLAPASISTYAIDQHALRAPREAEESVASLARYLTEPAENERESPGDLPLDRRPHYLQRRGLSLETVR